MKLFILAGEPSGDRIAADLVERLQQRVALELDGVGGDALAQVGLTSLFDMNELAVMGWADVLPRLPKLLWRARQVARAIVRTRPDVAVLVDAQVFSAIVAKQVHARAPDIPVVLCVAPAVWAWKPERAKELTPRFREVLAVLPFEPAFMRKVGGPETSYIGHPALQRFPLRQDVPERGPMLLLPGSREGELRRHLPLMQAVAERLKGHERVSGFILPTPRRLQERVARTVASWDAPVEVIVGEESKAAAFSNAVAAVAVTGTVTLELALAGMPMVTTYVADKGQAKRWVHYKVKYASLPNAILDRTLVPEILQLEPDAEALIAEVKRLLDERGAAAEQVAGFAEIRQLMEAGTAEAPRVDPAERVLRYLVT
ncbi:lipid-A-disaccharide synthase [Devosia lacusdianchii]|uniref:lipid-A-disaccharide synthase n=1 Tax=Devosia lacusdianchii TaxID=2917991 RepID=UPI001F067CB8|nr:lipid-A-disaccharide synthase [Devosia sp. JXJ CY 41]